VNTFDAQAFLDSAGLARQAVTYRRAETIFSQGDAADEVIYIRKGGVKLSAMSTAGREAVIAMLGPGDFIGEGCLAGQTVRMATATAMTPTTALVIHKDEMFRVLHAEHALSDQFIEYMLGRNVRIEEDLIDQLFSTREKRLARALLLLARFGTLDRPQRVLPNISSARLAEMVGTTDANVNAFLDKFRRLGFIEDDPTGLKINGSLLNVVLHD
jgi:CRP/FNR family cyclic AMP-dependent transcriptional regulator